MNENKNIRGSNGDTLLLRELDEISTKIANNTIKPKEIVNELALLSLKMNGNDFLRFVDVMINSLDAQTAGQINKIFDAVESGTIEKTDAKYYLMIIGQTDEVDHMLSRYVDEIKIISTKHITKTSPSTSPK